MPAFLIIDDDEDSRFLACHALRKAFPGSAVVAASTPAAAVAAAPRHRFDGVLTDHHLGAHDGIELMRQLRSAGVSCPVIVVTSSQDPRLHERALAAGAARVLSDIELDFVSFFRSLLPPGGS